MYGTSHTIDWWRAAAVWGSALPREGGGKRGCSKGPGHCPHPNGAWAAGGVGKEAPGLRAGGWGGVVRVPHHLGRAGRLIVHGVTFWYAHWCVVSCPFLENDEFELGQTLCDWAGTTNRVDAAYKFLRTVGETMQQIFFANLGGVVVTPNNHTVFKDVARQFKKHDGKLWVFLAHAIERAQDIHRNVIGALARG